MEGNSEILKCQKNKWTTIKQRNMEKYQRQNRKVGKTNYEYVIGR